MYYTLHKWDVLHVVKEPIITTLAMLQKSGRERWQTQKAAASNEALQTKNARRKGTKSKDKGGKWPKSASGRDESTESDSSREWRTLKKGKKCTCRGTASRVDIEEELVVISGSNEEVVEVSSWPASMLGMRDGSLDENSSRLSEDECDKVRDIWICRGINIYMSHMKIKGRSRGLPLWDNLWEVWNEEDKGWWYTHHVFPMLLCDIYPFKKKSIMRVLKGAGVWSAGQYSV